MTTTLHCYTQKQLTFNIPVFVGRVLISTYIDSRGGSHGFGLSAKLIESTGIARLNRALALDDAIALAEDIKSRHRDIEFTCYI